MSIDIDSKCYGCEKTGDEKCPDCLLWFESINTLYVEPAKEHKIINSEFHAGERYIGEMNGSVFTVLDIDKGNIRFKDEKTGRISITNLDNAKRLLLRKL